MFAQLAAQQQPDEDCTTNSDPLDGWKVDTQNTLKHYIYKTEQLADNTTYSAVIVPGAAPRVHYEGAAKKRLPLAIRSRFAPEEPTQQVTFQRLDSYSTNRLFIQITNWLR